MKAPLKSGRGRQRLEAEVLAQRLDQLPVFRGRSLQDEAGVVVQWRRVFVTPQAASGEVDHLLTAIVAGDFQAQIEIHTDHHRQLADQHQPVRGHIAEKADGFVGDAIEHSEEIRQLMPFDPAVGKHAQFAMQGSITEPRFCFGTCCTTETTQARSPRFRCDGRYLAATLQLTSRRCCPGLETRL